MAGLLVLFGLYLISLYSYLLFHTLVELFSIIVAGAIFLVAWNARHLLDNDYPLFLGISFLFVAVLDSLHTLAYQGMGVFPDFGTNVPTQLWLASRYLQASSFLVAPLFLRRRISARWTVAAGVLLVALILVSIFVWPVFPDAYVEGQGLTPFKVASEYVISGMLLLAGFLIWQRRQVFDPAVWRLLVAAILFNVGAELSFTFYIGVYDLSNLVGHFFKVLSFYFIYKAVVETGLVKPYSLLFRELKRSESGLREERDLISAILEVAGALIVVLDPQGRIVRFNRACELVTGYTAEAVRGLPLWDLFLLPEEIESVKAVFANLMSGQFPISYENYWLGKDGERRLITWSNTVILDEAGAVEYVVATGLDITEQRRAEVENLSLAQFPLQNPNPVLRVSAEGRILYGNEGSAPLLRCWNVEVGDSQPPEWCRFTEDVYRSGSRQESDVECDGRIYSLVYAPVLAGGYVNIYGMDVTNRRQIEVQLRKLSRAVEQSPSTVVITDTEGNIEYANPKFSELTGYSLDEVVGQSPRILRSEEHDEAFYRELWDTISAGDEWRGEFRNRKKNGEFYWEIASISPVRNGEGRIIHFVKVGEDISERKRREKRLHWQLEVNAALSHLSRALLSQISLDGVSSLVLEHAKRLTDSKFGYVGYIDPETGHLVCPTMTHDIWEVCKVKDKTPVFETFGGLWGWVLEQGRSLLTNAPAADPRSKGTPEGHLAIHTFVSAPALSGG